MNSDTAEASTSPKPALRKSARYRSANGESRPYKDGNRYKLRAKVLFPDGSHVFVVGSGSTMYTCKANTEKLKIKRQTEFQSKQEKPLTLGDYCHHWLENVRSAQPMAYRTKINYQSVIRLHIRPHIGHIPITELHRKDIQDLYAKLTSVGKSRSILKEVRAVLFGTLDEAVLSDLIAINCARSVKIPKKDRVEATHLSEEDARKVLEYAKRIGESAIWGVAIIMGIRQGERLGLRWSDLELEHSEGLMHIRHNLLRKKGKGLVLEALKTQSSYRSLGIPQSLIADLLTHRKSQLEKRLAAGQQWQNLDFVFTTPLGTPIDPSNDRKNWYALLEGAGVNPVKLHAARHTTATLMHANGVDIHSISQVLGHASISTTAEYYAHVPVETKLKAVNTLERVLTLS